MRKCRFCHHEIEDAAVVCPHCPQDLFPARPPEHATPVVRTVSADLTPAAVAHSSNARVTVVDIEMPFGSMVTFMVKWALAAIPAFLILGVLGALLIAVLAALGAAFGDTLDRPPGDVVAADHTAGGRRARAVPPDDPLRPHRVSVWPVLSAPGCFCKVMTA